MVRSQDTCVFSSLSSDLLYLEYEEVSLQIDECKIEIMNEIYTASFENLMGIITENIHHNTPDYFQRVCAVGKLLIVTNLI